MIVYRVDRRQLKNDSITSEMLSFQIFIGLIRHLQKKAFVFYVCSRQSVSSSITTEINTDIYEKYMQTGPLAAPYFEFEFSCTSVPVYIAIIILLVTKMTQTPLMILNTKSPYHPNFSDCQPSTNIS